MAHSLLGPAVQPAKSHIPVYHRTSAFGHEPRHVTKKGGREECRIHSLGEQPLALLIDA